VGRTCSANGEKNLYRLGTRLLGIQRRSWVDKIRMDYAKYRMMLCGLDWSGSEQGQVESSCECGNELSGSIKFWESVDWLYNWSSSAQLHTVS
jgi:hypothetical protein